MTMMNLSNSDSRSRTRIGIIFLAILLAVGAIVGSLAMSARNTGAFLSASVPGNVNGVMAKVDITGGGELNFAKPLAPGEVQTVTANFQNTSNIPVDVWIVFPDADKLHALNTLGTYGEFHLAGNGVPKFDSANLNDRASTCGPFSPSGCWPIPASVKLVDAVNAGATGWVDVSFGFAGKLTNTGDVPFNLPYKLVATQVGQTP